MSGPEERQRAVDLYSATPMTTAQVVEHLGHPTRQCLERWPAKDPGYAGHMAKPIILMETRAKAIEPVPGGMRQKRAAARASSAASRTVTALVLVRTHTVRDRERVELAPLSRHVPAWRHAGGSELIIVPWTAMIQSAQSFGHYRSPDATAIHKRDNFWSDLQICHI